MMVSVQVLAAWMGPDGAEFIEYHQERRERWGTEIADLKKPAVALKPLVPRRGLNWKQRI